MASAAQKVSPAEIVTRIFVLRRQRVMLDSDLAALYGVTVKRLNEQVRRNRKRFPPDFCFGLTISELRSLRSQFATLDRKRGRHRKYPPMAFTEHGAIMIANVLSSTRAIEMSVHVVRAFIKLRQVLTSNANLARKLQALETSVSALDAKTRKQLDEVYRAIQALMSTPAPRSRPIGFTADVEQQT